MGRGSESVSFFFPAYFDEKSISTLVKQFHAALKKTGRDFEIVVVDDGSPDRTGEVADSLAAQLDNVRVIHHGKNKGYGAVLTTGFSSAKKELAGFTDGDAQYSVRDLPKFLDAMEETDLVIGYRAKRADSFKRKVFQKGYKAMLLVLFGLKVRDPDCSFKMMRASVFRKIRPVSKSGFFSAEMIYRAKRAGLRIREVPVVHFERPYGKSTFLGMRRILRMLGDMLLMRLGLLR